MLGFRAGSILLIVVVALTVMAASGTLYQPTTVEQVRQAGTLRVATLAPMPGSLNRHDGSMGLEHDLVQHFADALGVEAVYLLTESKADLYRAVASGDAHIGLGGIGTSQQRERTFRYTEPVTEVDRQLIYRFGNRTPGSLADLADEVSLTVMTHSAHAEHLRGLRQQEYPELTWTETRTGSPEGLLYRVWNRELDYTVANSMDVQRTQRFYPELRVAFNLEENVGLRWALPAHGDETLLRAANSFLSEARENGLLAYLRERHLGHLREFDYVAARVFLRHVTERLPDFRAMFHEAAAENDVDWRLLAAIGYQESHWNPRAVSPTGVRGIMMLTQRTAAQVGVENRLDPEQSIQGGARYFRSLHARISEHIEEPTRTWFALAAYNVGMGHLEDARRLTEERGGDPDSWADVKATLPLLADPEWYPRTRFGYARGWEPVTYVGQVRTYYDLLLRISDEGSTPSNRPALRQITVPYGSGGNGKPELGGALQSAL